VPITSVPPYHEIAKSAAEIAKALGGRRCGSGWVARCPAHEDRRPSLSIRDGDGERVLVHCHAGCRQADVIEALRAQGLWPERRWRGWLPPAEFRRRLRARREAERRAEELTQWRRRQLELLIRMRNLLWDRRRAAEAWLEGPGRALDIEDPRVLRALRAATDWRAEYFARAVEQLERLRPGQLAELRERLRDGKETAA